MAANETIFKVSASAAKNTRTTTAQASALRERAGDDPSAFWQEIAQRLTWSKPFTKVKDTSFDADDLYIRWFEDGALNACVNCLDRHLPEHANDIAIIWEGDDPNKHKHITYQEAFEETSRMAKFAQSPRDWAWGSCRHLYADDPRSSLCDACLRAHWRCSFSCVWWFFTGGACEPY